MVSGLVTAPCDQLRIFSGDARLMRIASKSAIVFCISNGLERNKVFLRFLLSVSTEYLVPGTEVYVPRHSRAPNERNVLLQTCLRVLLVPKSRFYARYSGLGTRYFSLLPRWPWASSPRS